MKTFVFQFNQKLYKATGNTASSILQQTGFSLKDLIKMKFEGFVIMEDLK